MPRLLPTRPHPNQPWTNRRGVAVVEFAVIGALLAFLIVGTIEVSRGLMVKEALSYSARTACRQGILPDGTNAAMRATVETLLQDNKIDTSQLTVTIKVNDSPADVSTAKTGDKVSLQVSVPAAKVSWVPPLFLGGRSIESETYVMMKQR